MVDVKAAFKRGNNPVMDLPDGKTCKDCFDFTRCYNLFGRLPEDEVCDWAPSRFREVSANA